MDLAANSGPALAVCEFVMCDLTLRSVPLLFLYSLLSNVSIFGVERLFGPNCLLMLNITMSTEDTALRQVKGSTGKIGPRHCVVLPCGPSAAPLGPSVCPAVVACPSPSLAAACGADGPTGAQSRGGLLLPHGRCAPSQVFYFSETILLCEMEKG